MDLERIKQNLRLRSGRSRKARQRQQPPASQAPQASKPEPQQSRTTTATTRDQFSQTVNSDPKEDVSIRSKDVSPPQQAEQNHRELRTVLRLDSAAPPSPLAHDPNISSEDRSTQPQVMEQQQGHAPDDSEDQDYDLRPPAPKPKPASLETTCALLFSASHLNAILHDQKSIARFTAFLNKFKPEYQPLIIRYLETQKAIKAVEYANAVAAGASEVREDTSKDVQRSLPSTAAKLDGIFEDASNAAFKALVGTALPMYITYSLVKVVSELLVDEITGKQSVIMQSLVGGLSEVFCITDPKQEDNPIIYASEEFYRYTGYGSEDVIGHNCRFLQGPKTSRDSPRRLKEAIENGEEICEALLNYRRDGRPFINLLMIAPLHDNKGDVKYNIGAQVDVTGLVENGTGLDFFARYLAAQRIRSRHRAADTDQRKQKQLIKLRELSEMFDLEESAVVQTHSRASSLNRADDTQSTESLDRSKPLRRLFVADSGSDLEDDDDDLPHADGTKDAWKLAQEGPGGQPSGRLPGVYDTYMLIRPAPSLRIIFVSRKLQKLVKSIQAPFLSHVAGPPKTLAGLKESFIAGVPVSAKVSFSREPSGKRDGVKVASDYKHEDGQYGKACWISATPMLGSDDRPGVWMVVFVQKSTMNKGKHNTAKGVEAKVEAEMKLSTLPKESPEHPAKTEEKSQATRTAPSKSLDADVPIKPVRLNGQESSYLDNEKRPGGEGLHEVEPGSYATGIGSTAGAGFASASSTPTRQAEERQTQNLEAAKDPEFRSSLTADETAVDGTSAGHNHQKSNEETHTQQTSPPFSRQRSDTGYQSTSNLHLDADKHQTFTPPPDMPINTVTKTPRGEDGRREDASDQSGSDDVNDTPIATRINTNVRSSDEAVPDIRQHPASPLSESAGRDVHKTDSEAENEVPDPDLEEADSSQPSLGRDTLPRTGMVMDYLSHPGSAGRRRVNAEEFSRALQAKEDGNSDSWDAACLRSPYSVD